MGVWNAIVFSSTCRVLRVFGFFILYLFGVSFDFILNNRLVSILLRYITPLITGLNIVFSQNIIEFDLKAFFVKIGLNYTVFIYVIIVLLAISFIREIFLKIYLDKNSYDNKEERKCCDIKKAELEDFLKQLKRGNQNNKKIEIEDFFDYEQDVSDVCECMMNKISQIKNIGLGNIRISIFLSENWDDDLCINPPSTKLKHFPISLKISEKSEIPNPKTIEIDTQGNEKNYSSSLAFNTGEATFIFDTLSDKRYDMQNKIKRKKVRSMISYPIELFGNIWGVINVEILNKRCFIRKKSLKEFSRSQLAFFYSSIEYLLIGKVFLNRYKP